MKQKSLNSFLILICLLSISCCFCQTTGLVSGPWAGNVELRNATIWVEVSPKVKSVAVSFNKEGRTGNNKTTVYKGELGKDFNPVKIELNGLDINTTYGYSIV